MINIGKYDLQTSMDYNAMKVIPKPKTHKNIATCEYQLKSEELK